MLAHAHLITGDREGARPLLAAAASTTPRNATVAMQTVQMLDAAGLYAAVLPYLERCVNAPDGAAATAAFPTTDLTHPTDATAATADPTPLGQSPELVTELVLRRFESGRIADALDLLEGGHAVESLYVDCVEAIALNTAGRRAEAAEKVRTLNAHPTNRYRAAGAVLAAALPEDGGTADTQAVTDAARGLNEHGVRVAYLDAIVADAYQRRGQNAEAEAAYRAALQQRPAWAGPCLGLAGLFLATGDEAQAYRFAVAAGEREGRSLRVAVMTARAAGARVDQLTSAQLTELGDLIDGVQRAQPGEPTTAVLRVDVLARQGRTAEATEAALAAARLDPPISEDALLRLGASARRNNLDAVAELEAAYLERFGQTPRIAMTRATEAAVGGDADEAVAAFDASVPADAGPEWRVNRALLYERVGHPDALARWTEAADSAPDNVRVQARVLTSPVVWADRGLTDRTIERLKAADPEGVAWRTERARYLLTDAALADDPAATAREVERLLAEAADGGAATLNVLVMQATARRLLGDPRGASQLLEKASLQNPNDVSLQLELAQTLAAAGDRERALDTARRIADRKDLPAASRRSVARLLGQLGDLTAAAAGLEALRDAGNASPSDLLALARLYRNQQRPEDAAALLPELLAALDADTARGSASGFAIAADAKADAVVFAADVYAAAGQTDAANATLDRLDGLDLTPARRLTLRAAHAASRGRLDDSRRGLRRRRAGRPVRPRGLAQPRRVPAAFRRSRGRAGSRPPGRRRGRGHAGDRGPAGPVGADSAPARRFLAHSALQHAGQPRRRPRCRRQRAEDARSVPQRPGRPTRRRARRPRRRTPPHRSPGGAGHQRAAPRRPDRRRPAAGHRRGRPLPPVGRSGPGFGRRPRPAPQLEPDAHRHRPLAFPRARRQPGRRHARRPGPPPARPPRPRAGGALPYRERILDRPESTPVLTRQYAILLAMAGRHQEARSLLQPLLSTGTYWRMTWLDVATQGVRNTQDAGGWLQQVEGVLDESQLIERSAIAQAWWALGRRDEYAPFLERARTRLDTLAADPDANADVWFFLGTIAEHDGQPAVAAERYRKSLELAPNAINVRNNLAMVLAREPDASASQLDEAVQLATTVVKARPDEPNFLDTQAAVLTIAGRYDEALAAIRQAIELDPGNPDWRRREDKILAAQEGWVVRVAVEPRGGRDGLDGARRRCVGRRGDRARRSPRGWGSRSGLGSRLLVS